MTRIAGPSLGTTAGSVVALLQVIGYVGGVGAWIATSARLPFVAGLDRHLPPVFGRIHPKWGTPYIALLLQAGITVVLIAMSHSAGATAERAYNLLIKLSTITYFIPYLYLFIAFMILQRHPRREGTLRAPGGRPGAYAAGMMGFAVTAGSILLACLPERDEQNPAAFYGAIAGTVGANILVGLLLYWSGRRRRLRGVSPVASDE
jgi:amino acid transporter